MLKVKGVYDGTSVILLEPVALLPDTKVEVLIPDADGEAEQPYWQRLIEEGLLEEFRPRPLSSRPFTPVQVNGPPLWQAIIEGRFPRRLSNCGSN